jgi:hypothetical protein
MAITSPRDFRLDLTTQRIIGADLSGAGRAGNAE